MVQECFYAGLGNQRCCSVGHFDPRDVPHGQPGARQLSKAEVKGIDVDGDFPYEAVQAWAKAHGRSQELDALGAFVEKQLDGDSIVVMFGAGHAFLLRQCVSEMPGWKLVEPAAYLPKT
jgi:hypothetical protein